MKEIWPAESLADKVLRSQPAVAGRRYRRSQFCLPFESEGRRYLFHTLTRQCLRLDGAALPEAPFVYDARETDGALRALIARRFLVPEEQDECALYESVIRVLRRIGRRGGMFAYTILPTTACNARCVYCYEAGMRTETMSPQTVEDTIAFILRTRDPGKKIRLGWFGGEPLAAVGIIDRISGALEDAGVDFYSDMITNGSLIDDSVAARMAGPWRLRRIQLSMDCAEREYVRRKNYPVYRGEYRAVMAAAGDLAARGIDVVVRCNVDEDNVQDMDEFIRDLDRALPDKSRISVYFLPLYDVRLTKSSGRIWAACVAADARLRSAGFKTARAARVRRLKQQYCMAESPDACVVVAPDGRLYNCEHCPPGNVLGTVREGVVNRALAERLSRVEPAQARCRGCAFLPECMTFTGCPVHSAICKEQQSAWMLQALADGVARAERAEGEGGAAAGEDEAVSQC